MIRRNSEDSEREKGRKEVYCYGFFWVCCCCFRILYAGYPLHISSESSEESNDRDGRRRRAHLEMRNETNETRMSKKCIRAI